jgi:ABC-type Zn2+ transport system substrate-binding protein/surface adhesin
MNAPALGEVLFEFHRVGAVVKVSAIHAATGTEVVLVGAASAGEYALKMAAMRKLAYVLGRPPVGGSA